MARFDAWQPRSIPVQSKRRETGRVTSNPSMNGLSQIAKSFSRIESRKGQNGPGSLFLSHAMANIIYVLARKSTRKTCTFFK